MGGPPEPDLGYPPPPSPELGTPPPAAPVGDISAQMDQSGSVPDMPIAAPEDQPSDEYGGQQSNMLVVLEDEDDVGSQTDGYSGPDVDSLPPEDDEEQSGGLPPLPG